MQRVLVTLAVILLVTASLGVGALAANWPFWRRAWSWHMADGGWPTLPAGAHAIVNGGGGSALQFEPAAADLDTLARSSDTQLLLRVRGERAEAWTAPGFNQEMTLDGHGLSALLLLPLFDALEQQQPGLLDRPIGAWFDELKQDVRGAFTPRQLLAQSTEHLAVTPHGNLLNPFRSAARLASGPDFRRAALALLPATPPDSRRAGSARAAAAQLLANVAAAAGGGTYAAVVEQRLWAGLAAHDAVVMLGRRRGEAAAHCCLRARASDWLRLGLRLGNSGGAALSGPVRVFVTGDRALAVAEGAAVLWVGTGAPPAGLEMLLLPPPDL